MAEANNMVKDFKPPPPPPPRQTLVFKVEK